MGSRRWWSVVLGVAVAIGFAVPAGAAETTFDDTCADVYGHSAVGDLDKTTDPPGGSAVTPGQPVSITLEWPTFAVAGERPNRVIECLSVDSGAPRLWAEKFFTSGDGTVTLSTTVPGGLAPKSTACSQSFLKTKGSFGPVTRYSEKTCFPVGKDASFHALSRVPSPPAESSPRPDSRSNTPTTRAPLFSSPPPPSSRPPSSSSPPSDSGDYQAPWPPWESGPRTAAAPPVSTTPTTSKATTPTTRRAQGTESAAPAATPGRAPSQTLPRTGAGVVLLLGIAAVALFSGRTLRKTAHHIEDVHLPVDAVPVDDTEPTLVLGRRW
jgi:hypothetical protein